MNSKKHRQLPEFETIQAAIKGDVDAINQILCYFQPFIQSECKREYKDEFGRTYYVKMIYTTDVIVEEHEFAQNKDNSGGENSTGTPKTDKDGFMEAAEGEIPFD